MRVYETVTTDNFYPRPPGGGRLLNLPIRSLSATNFYPRPPGGGRRARNGYYQTDGAFLSTPSGWRATFTTCRPPTDPPLFLSTPSGWRATVCKIIRRKQLFYFYPRPPGGGRQRWCASRNLAEPFLSTPSGWRATAKTDKVFVCFCAKGRRICLFKTRKEKICRWRFKKDKFWVLIWCEGSGKSVCASASHCG